MQPELKALNLPATRGNCVREFSKFLGLIQDVRKETVVFIRNGKELFYFVRGNKERPFFLKYHYKQGKQWVSEWFCESVELPGILDELILKH
jgi:hypothetical protein